MKPGSGQSKVTKWWLLPIFAAAITLPTLWPRALSLSLADGFGREVAAFPVAAGDRFSIAFTHSLALSGVEEIFEVTGRHGFALRETVYEDFGAGLPHEETPGLTMEFADGRIRLSGYDVRFGELYVRVGRIADHQLHLPGGRSVRLAEYIEPGQAVRLAVTSKPWGLDWLGN